MRVPPIGGWLVSFVFCSFGGRVWGVSKCSTQLLDLQVQYIHVLDDVTEDGSSIHEDVQILAETEMTRTNSAWSFVDEDDGGRFEIINNPTANNHLIYDNNLEDFQLTDIGNDILVPKHKLELLMSTTSTSPTKFVRGLLLLVFNKEELRGRSVTGRRRHAFGTGKQKDPLDCARLNAIVDYTLCIFPGTSIVKIRQTISNKLKEVNNSTANMATGTSGTRIANYKCEFS